MLNEWSKYKNSADDKNINVKKVLLAFQISRDCFTAKALLNLRNGRLIEFRTPKVGRGLKIGRVY